MRNYFMKMKNMVIAIAGLVLISAAQSKEADASIPRLDQLKEISVATPYPLDWRGSFFPTGGKPTGDIVELPNWTYPVVCLLETGEVKYDSYKGHL